GGLFAESNAYVTLDVLSFARSGTVLIMLVLGGAGRLYGAFVGTAVYMILEDELAKLSPEFWEFGIGLLLVVVVLFFRQGLLGALEDLQRRLS
nr:branched-chain amino acid ABC transporter permease [Alphaproteobacteria bacterium]